MTELMVDNTMISRAGENEKSGHYDCGSMTAEWTRINMPGLERLHMDQKTIFILRRKVRSRPSWVL